ncbi:hypothetical protein M8J75_003872 [Diaphorina citri]|nr:hypothetical protein M8J75_003872 [Diaphorina citri]
MAVFRNYYNRLLNTPLDLDEYREECRTIRAIGFNNGFTSQEMRKIFNSTRRHRMNQLVYSTKPVEPPSIYVKLPFISNLENRLLPTLNKYKYYRVCPKFISVNVKIKLPHYAETVTRQILIKELKKKYALRDTIYLEQMFWHLQLAHQVTNVEFDSYDEKVRGIAHSVVTSQRLRQQRKLESLLNSKRLNTRTHSIDRQFEKRFINLSDVTFEEKEQTLLNKGMKYATSPKFDDNLVNNVVVSIQSRIPAMRMTDRHTLLHQVSVNVNKEERCNGKQRNRDVRIMKSIRLKLANNNLIMTKADKSSTIVVLEQQEYNNKVLEFINKDPLIRPLANNPTNRCQSNIGCFLKSMKELTPNPKLLKVINPIAPRLYGNLKIHKVQRTNAKEAPIRPVVSAVTSPTYLLEKFLVKTIKRALPNFKSQYSVKNSKELIDKIKNMQVPERGNLISLDVKTCSRT